MLFKNEKTKTTSISCVVHGMFIIGGIIFSGVIFDDKLTLYSKFGLLLAIAFVSFLFSCYLNMKINKWVHKINKTLDHKIIQTNKGVEIDLTFDTEENAKNKSLNFETDDFLLEYYHQLNDKVEICKKIPEKVEIYKEDVLIKKIKNKNKKTKIRLKNNSKYKLKLFFNNEKTEKIYDNIKCLMILGDFKGIKPKRVKKNKVLYADLHKYKNNFFLKLKINYEIKNDTQSIKNNIKFFVDNPDFNKGKNYDFAKSLYISKNNKVDFTPKSMIDILKKSKKKNIYINESGTYNLVYNLGDLDKNKISAIKIPRQNKGINFGVEGLFLEI